MLRYAITILLSAFLLFQVQPLIGRYILPWFGGGPSIWTVCMLFFQVLLLGGYLYAHLLTTWLSPRRQVVVHLIVVGVSLLFLPVEPSTSWKPPGGDAPLLRILLLLSATVGAPYFVLASTGPLLQKWFSQTSPGRSPWRLYALSNAGSLLALVSYPFVFEPWLKLRQQVWSWSAAYAVFAAAAAWCAWRMKQHSAAHPDAAAGASSVSHVQAEPAPGIGRKLLWLGLSASGSVLLLATTNQLCLDVATVPFLWVLPLSLYLLTFIICFDSPHWYDRRIFGLLLLVCSPAACFSLEEGASVAVSDQILVYASTLLAGCMCCHGELVRLRPGAQHLTLFYVLVSAGGAAGGLFVALVAPAVFDGYYEYHFGLTGCGVFVLLAWIAQRVWRQTPAPAFWIWTASVAAQSLMFGGLYYRDHAYALNAVDHSVLLAGWGLLQLISLAATARFRDSSPWLSVVWPLLAALPVVWIVGYDWSRGSHVSIKPEVLWSLGGAAMICSQVAAMFVHLTTFRSPRTRTHLVRWGVLIATVVVLAALGQWNDDEPAASWQLTKWQMFALATTTMSAILMEWSSAGFRGPGRSSLGFWFIVPVVTVLLLLINRLAESVNEETQSTVHQSRNFYGVLRVVEKAAVTDEDGNELEPAKYSLTHGQIQHGFQFQDPAMKRLPTTYYGPLSGVGLSISVQRNLHVARGDGLRVGVVGLGTGTIAAYGQPGDNFRFFDINPAVHDLSTNGVFTYLSDSPATTDVVIGDARLMMEREVAAGGGGKYDVLAIDAFSSDAIPVHLLTAECSEVYRDLLRPDGVLAIHISNRFLNLEPVTRGLADHLGWQAIRIENESDDATGVFNSDWILLTASDDFASDPQITEASTPWGDPDRVLHWTDDYSGLWQVLTW